MTNSISVAGGDSLICSSNPSKTINSDDAVGNHTGISNISSYFSRYLLTFFRLVAEYEEEDNSARAIESVTCEIFRNLIWRCLETLSFC
jgi:hypothetical protein